MATRLIPGGTVDEIQSGWTEFQIPSTRRASPGRKIINVLPPLQISQDSEGPCFFLARLSVLLETSTMRGAPSLRSYALRPTSQSPVAARITSALAIASLAGAMLIPPDMGGGTVRRYHGRSGPRTCVLAQLAQTTSSALPIQSNTRLCQDVREQEALRQGRGQSRAPPSAEEHDRAAVRPLMPCGRRGR